MKRPLDLTRIRFAMRDLDVEGLVGTSAVRIRALEEAIAAIQADGQAALRDRYIGVKVYAGFGDQRSDHSYGTVPGHGHIVFRIGRRAPRAAVELGADHIYLLECCRDWEPWEDVVPEGFGRSRQVWRSLPEVVREHDRLEDRFNAIRRHLAAATVEAHAGEEVVR